MKMGSNLFNVKQVKVRRGRVTLYVGWNELE